ncbi:hypothetical protein ILUMI_23720 [Ignelater luminosus]|uniref:Peptidase aspartic putative domain-containing protein n=1 Tax=Ignelater luminosus TaxID=2038154 RepID=A0A8K0CDB5_IGNLU|nr:hypothetical protein ILUMI_23720 [Ignelater luminosus]
MWDLDNVIEIHVEPLIINVGEDSSTSEWDDESDFISPLTASASTFWSFEEPDIISALVITTIQSAGSSAFKGPDECNKERWDVGSQGSFITKEVCKKLGLTSKSTNISISGLGQNESTVKTITTAKIKSLYNEFTLTIPLLVVAKITDPLPNFTVQLSQIKIPKNIILADPEFYIPSKIDILLGADIFWQLLCVGQIHLDRSQPYFQKTQLGWVAGGSVPNPLNSNRIATHLSTINSENALESQISKFSELESDHSQAVLSPEKQACEKHFKDTYARDNNGRFIGENLDGQCEMLQAFTNDHKKPYKQKED